MTVTNVQLSIKKVFGDGNGQEAVRVKALLLRSHVIPGWKGSISHLSVDLVHEAVKLNVPFVHFLNESLNALLQLGALVYTQKNRIIF